MKQSILQNVWINISEMRHSTVRNKIIIDQLRQEMKLGSILKEQVDFIDINYNNISMIFY